VRHGGGRVELGAQEAQPPAGRHVEVPFEERVGEALGPERPGPLAGGGVVPAAPGDAAPRQERRGRVLDEEHSPAEAGLRRDGLERGFRGDDVTPVDREVRRDRRRASLDVGREDEVPGRRELGGDGLGRHVHLGVKGEGGVGRQAARPGGRRGEPVARKVKVLEEKPSGRCQGEGEGPRGREPERPRAVHEDGRDVSPEAQRAAPEAPLQVDPLGLHREREALELRGEGPGDDRGDPHVDLVDLDGRERGRLARLRPAGRGGQRGAEVDPHALQGKAPDVQAPVDRLAGVEVDVGGRDVEERAGAGYGGDHAPEPDPAPERVEGEAAGPQREPGGLLRFPERDGEDLSLDRGKAQQKKERHRDHHEEGQDERNGTAPGADAGDLCAAGHTPILEAWRRGAAREAAGAVEP
jgi:hypothetical protein